MGERESERERERGLSHTAPPGRPPCGAPAPALAPIDHRGPEHRDRLVTSQLHVKASELDKDKNKVMELSENPVHYHKPLWGTGVERPVCVKVSV